MQSSSLLCFTISFDDISVSSRLRPTNQFCSVPILSKLFKCIWNFTLILYTFWWYKYSHGTDKKYSLICRNNKIVIPKQLQKRIVEWCHHTLCHSGETHTELTIAQHLYRNNSRKTVHDICSKCDDCQFLKQGKRNYGKLPPKQAKAQPWDVLCIDYIDRYKFSAEGGKAYKLISTHIQLQD